MAGKPKDLTGQKFNMLTALEPTDRRSSGAVIWKCRCDCGAITEVKSSALRNGGTKSCGCLQKTRSQEVNRKNIAGVRFGKLIACAPTDKRSSGSIVWLCECDCGNKIEVRASSLQSGHTYSCGCFTESKGETKIKQLLKFNKIPFEQEKTFISCRIPETEGVPRFDFYVDNKYLIEFDGAQHFQVGGDFATPEKLKQTQFRDQYKNEWCKEHNIPLIRIPYTHLNNITIKDLLLETTSFLI